MRAVLDSNLLSKCFYPFLLVGSFDVPFEFVINNLSQPIQRVDGFVLRTSLPDAIVVLDVLLDLGALLDAFVVS